MKKQTEIERLKQKFIWIDNEPCLLYWGDYRLGLTEDEIKDYLRVRANTMKIEKVWKQFCDIAGCNTMALYECPDCFKSKGLMYRHDVKRFAERLFNGTITYWD